MSSQQGHYRVAFDAFWFDGKFKAAIESRPDGRVFDRESPRVDRSANLQFLIFNNFTSEENIDV